MTLLARDEPLLALLAAASLRTRIAAGPHTGEPWRRVGDRIDPGEPGDEPDASPQVAECRGLSLHAAVVVPARDRLRLERVCRYVARPPLANDRLEECPDGRLLLRLKTRWRDGTTHVLMERSELLDRLVPLIPPPRAHQVRDHGILAPCASLRSRVVPSGEVGFALCLPVAEGAEATPASGARAAADPAPPVASDTQIPEREPPREDRSAGKAPRRFRWAALLQRVFGVDALRCPRCGSTLRLVAAIEDPAIARRIPGCIGLPARAPPVSPAASSDVPSVEEPGMSTRRRPTIRDPARPSRYPASFGIEYVPRPDLHARNAGPDLGCVSLARDSVPRDSSAAAQLEIARCGAAAGAFDVRLLLGPCMNPARITYALRPCATLIGSTSPIRSAIETSGVASFST